MNNNLIFLGEMTPSLKYPNYFPDQVHKDIKIRFINGGYNIHTGTWTFFEGGATIVNGPSAGFDIEFYNSPETFNNGQRKIITIFAWSTSSTNDQATLDWEGGEHWYDISGQRNYSSYVNSHKITRPNSQKVFSYHETIPYWDGSTWAFGWNNDRHQIYGSLDSTAQGIALNTSYSFNPQTPPADRALSYTNFDISFRLRNNSTNATINDPVNIYKMMFFSQDLTSKFGTSYNDLFRGLSSLCLPGQLIENNSQPSRFTNTGNLLIKEEFIEGGPTFIDKTHAEAYELIEY